MNKFDERTVNAPPRNLRDVDVLCETRDSNRQVFFREIFGARLVQNLTKAKSSIVTQKRGSTPTGSSVAKQENVHKAHTKFEVFVMQSKPIQSKLSARSACCKSIIMTMATLCLMGLARIYQARSKAPL
jgi:hypothetical protein